MNGREKTRLAYGLVLLVAPDRLTNVLTGRRLDGRGRAVARVLGARHLLQAIVVTRVDSARRLGRVVDRMHAASMLGIAVFDSRRRRLALIDTGVASLFSLAGTKPSRVEEILRPATDSLLPANLQDSQGPRVLAAPPASADYAYLETGKARRRRSQAARTQRAIVDAVDTGKGQPVATVKRELVRALKSRGVSPKPEAWLNAVAAEATLGNIYVVDEQAVAATARALRHSDPQ
jgi:hypothetical protein